MFWIKRCSVILIIAALIVVGGCAPAKESVEVPDTKTVEKNAEKQGG